MTPDSFRRYIADPAKDANPAILAARALLDERDALKAERDRLMRELARRADLEVRIEVLHQEAAELKAAGGAYRKEHERIRAEIDKLLTAPWEDDDGRDRGAADADRGGPADPAGAEVR